MTTPSEPSNPIDIVDLAQQLVRIESVSGTEGQQTIFSLVGDLMHSAGFVVSVDPSSQPAYLVVRSRTFHGDPALVFACHVDTVPVGDALTWSVNPIGGEVADGRLFGRGASDMKGGLAACVGAMIAAGSDGPPTMLLLTTDEEVGCLGAAEAVAVLKDLPVGAIIVPESTNGRIALGHRGALWLELSRRGVAAHGSTPELGINALLALAKDVIDIESNMPRCAGFSILSATTVNVGLMEAGVVPNVVPDLARAVIDIRYADESEPGGIVDWLKGRNPLLEVDEIMHVPRLLTDAKSDWIQSLPAPLAEPASMGYFTDGPFLQAGAPHAPIVIWGPGQPDLAHSRDESVSVDGLNAVYELYSKAIADWSLDHSGLNRRTSEF